MKTPRQFLSALAFLMTISFLASSQNKVGVGDAYPGKVAYAAFTLGNDEKVTIDGMGGVFRRDGRLLVCYGWIIDGETRKVVWHLGDERGRVNEQLGEFDIRDEVALKKGTYEVYFTEAFHNRSDWSVNGIFAAIFDGQDDDDKNRYAMKEGMGMTVSSPSLTKVSTASVIDKKVGGAVVSILKPGDDANIKKGFSLTGETTLHIYAIGEGNKDETFDYAWIYDMDTHKRVWVMDYGNTDFAGGADKNMVVDEKIKLPAGNYLVSYTTDDSHSFNEWNAMPPSDPQFSGITVWAESAADKKNVVAFRATEELKPVLQLTRIHDEEHVSRGLKVNSAMDLRVLCLGEFTDNEAADYGWIVNAATREIVWDMSRVRREHAGGAKKNKMVDAVVHLEKGDYIVSYVTDDSHAYSDWNAGPPHEQDYYGITLWATRKEDLAKATTFDPGEFKNDKVIVEIVRVRDDEQLSESFTLDKDTNLRIFALGEGVDGDMVDYGWIRNTETGKVVWEMTYRNTESAGGANKNRMYNDTVILPKGSYKVYYETDGSHSYHNWNATPPREPERYGISLMKEIN